MAGGGVGRFGGASPGSGPATALPPSPSTARESGGAGELRRRRRGSDGLARGCGVGVASRGSDPDRSAAGQPPAPVHRQGSEGGAARRWRRWASVAPSLGPRPSPPVRFQPCGVRRVGGVGSSALVFVIPDDPSCAASPVGCPRLPAALLCKIQGMVVALLFS